MTTVLAYATFTACIAAARAGRQARRAHLAAAAAAGQHALPTQLPAAPAA